MKYMYRMGILPKHAPRNKRVHFLLKEDLTYLDEITKQTDFLFQHEIESAEALMTYKTQLDKRVEYLAKYNRSLNNRISRASGSDIESLEQEHQKLLTDLSKCREEKKICEEIYLRSQIMENKLTEVEREEKEDESRRRHSRPNGKDDPRGN